MLSRWQDAAKTMFSALTFNMQNGQVWDDSNPDAGPVNIEESVAFLRAQNADIIFLQEVERGYDGGEQQDPPPHYQRLKAALSEYDSVFGYPLPNPFELPFGLGLAIFSRTPLKSLVRTDLPPADITFDFGGKQRRPSHRLLLSVETEIEGHPLRLLNTHLQAFFMINALSDDHPEQRNVVEAELRKSNLPTLLGGDFNCSPRETLVDQFAKVGFRPAQSVAITWRRMPFVLDHIFYNAALQLERSEVVATKASDHNAVRADFSFTA